MASMRFCIYWVVAHEMLIMIINERNLLRQHTRCEPPDI